MGEKYLTIVLLEDVPFDELVLKLEKVLDTLLPYKNEKGRLIARGNLERGSIAVIDRYDDLDEILCDDYYSLKITIDCTESEYEEIENKIKEKFKNTIKWKYGRWSPVKVGEARRRTYPDRESELYYPN